MIARPKNGSCHRENIIQRNACRGVRATAAMRAHIRASIKMRESLSRLASGVYQIPPATVLAWQASCDEVLPLIGGEVAR